MIKTLNLVSEQYYGSEGKENCHTDSELEIARV